MPESMFGCPSQHLLSSQPSNNTSEDCSQTAPVLPARPRFADVSFETIGKQPELLSRISLFNTAPFHSPSPSPASRLPLTSSIQPSSSRPTLFQKLAGGENMLDSPALRTKASDGILATRIQSNLSHSANGITDLPLSRPRLNRGRYMAVEGNDPSSPSLIPPIEFLSSHESEGSSPPPRNENGVVVSHRAEKSRMHCGPATAAAGAAISDLLHPSSSLLESWRTTSSQHECPPGTSNIVQSKSTDPPVPFISQQTTTCTISPPAVASALSLPMTEFVRAAPESGQREPSQQSSTFNLESLASRHARLQAINNNLMSLMSPSFSPASSSSLPGPPGPSITQAHNDGARQEPLQQGNGDAIVLHHAYPVQHHSPSGEFDHPVNSVDNVDPLALTSTVTREFQTQTKNILGAVHNLSATLGSAHRAHVEAENALVHQRRALDRQRALFAEHQRADEAAFQARLRELVQKEEELRAKEAAIFARETENQAKEGARRVLDATRRVQEEAKREEEEARRQDVQQQIVMALKELDDLGTLRSEGRLRNGPQASVSPLHSLANEGEDLPRKAEADMSEEEVNVVEQRNGVLAALKRLRRMHEQKMHVLHESTNNLRRLQEERKKAAEERERCRLADEEQQRTLAEGSEQVMHGAETEKERAAEENTQHVTQPARNAAGQDQLPTTQQTHGDTRVSLQVLERGEQEPVQGRQQQELSGQRAEAITVENAARIRAAKQGDIAHDGTVGVDGSVMKHSTQPSPALDTWECTVAPPHGALPSSPAKKVVSAPISGGVMLSTSQQSGSINSQFHRSSGAQRPPTSSGSSALGSLNHAAVKAPSFVSASTEAGRKVTTDAPLFSIQLASELHSVGNVNEDAQDSCPRSPPSQTQVFTSNLKSHTVLDAVASGSQELDLGPPTGVSSAQRSVNLRHLKKSLSRIEENEGGRRSSGKSEEGVRVTLKMEEGDEQPLSHNTESARKEKNEVSVPLPRRPPVIPPPRPRIPIKPAVAVSPPQHQQLPFTGGETETEQSTASMQPELAPPRLPRASPSPWVMDASAGHQEWASTSIDSVDSFPWSPQDSASHPGPFAEPTIQPLDEHDHQSSASLTRVSPEYKSGALSSPEEEEHPKSRPRLSDESYKKRNRKGGRRQTDHYSPSPALTSRVSVPSPPPSHRQSGDFWRPSTTSEIQRAQPMRARAPLAGRKRPFEINDDEHDHRHRRLKGSGWEASGRGWETPGRGWETPGHGWETPGRGWEASDRGREGFDRGWEVPRRGKHHPPSSEYFTTDRLYLRPQTPPTPPTVPPLSAHSTSVRGQDSYWRPQEEINRNEPFEVARAPMGDQPSQYDYGHGEGVQHDPALLARMSDTQRHPPAAHTRNPGGRGRGAPGRGKGDSSRGRGDLRSRDVTSKPARVGNHLIGRISDGPALLQDRLGEPTQSWRSPSN